MDRIFDFVQRACVFVFAAKVKITFVFGILTHGGRDSVELVWYIFFIFKHIPNPGSTESRPPYPKDGRGVQAVLVEHFFRSGFYFAVHPC